MKKVYDRVVQYANRYKLTNVSTGEELGTFDFAEAPGTVSQAGTEIDAELFDGMTDEEIEEAVVDAGLCEEIDCQCGHVLKAAVKKACKAAGLAFESLEPCAMWED